jgi:hypothetical protein
MKLNESRSVALSGAQVVASAGGSRAQGRVSRARLFTKASTVSNAKSASGQAGPQRRRRAHDATRTAEGGAPASRSWRTPSFKIIARAGPAGRGQSSATRRIDLQADRIAIIGQQPG